MYTLYSIFRLYFHLYVFILHRNIFKYQKMIINRIVLGILVFLLPLHAFIVTILMCKYAIDTNLIRFWKEVVIIFLVIYLFFIAYKKHNWSLGKLYHKNTLLGLITLFIACSIFYIYFPAFQIRAASVLGFRYDVFFLLALLVGLYGIWLEKDMRFLLKILFLSTFWILIVFLPWYLFGNIEGTVEMFGYSGEASTYTANSCLSFSQNVEGGHNRFQATFGGPIRMSVFLTLVGSLFMWYILSATSIRKNNKYFLVAGFAILILPAIFFSYSKTSMLGALFAIWIFSLLTYKLVYRRKINQKMYVIAGWIMSLPILTLMLLKWDMFLHLWAVLNRLENLGKSVQMFFYNPFGYGLGIAGPASQIGNSIESAGNWVIATNSVSTVHRFLPENWYVQILLEQGIVWGAIFMSLIILIGVRLIARIQRHRDFMSVGITTAYFALCFMALFTHAFEEAASSYILFLFIWIILAESMTLEKNTKK